MKPYYLATPYTRYPGGYDAAFDTASRIAARLYERGVLVFGPISHSHPISARLIEARPTYEHWLELDFWAIDNSAGVLVAQLPTWRDSVGVKKEIGRAQFDELPVLYLDPLTLDMRFEPFPEDHECPAP